MLTSKRCWGRWSRVGESGTVIAHHDLPVPFWVKEYSLFSSAVIRV
jgi:hypothetical protein